MKRFVPIVLLATILVSSSGSVAQDKVMTVKDSLAIKNASNFTWTPDGERVIFSIREWEEDDNRYVSHIYAVEKARGTLHQLTRLSVCPRVGNLQRRRRNRRPRQS